MLSVKSVSVTVTVLVYTLFVYGGKESDTNHECIRSCEWPPKPKTCVYNLLIEWFYAAGDICMSGCPNSTVPNPDNVECHQDKDCILLNGMPRAVLVANRSWPGPSIQVCEGDNIVVHVTNNMTAQENEATSIHWHGMHQRGTPYMDGSFMITQCPILVGQTFTYNFTAFPSGTHWWHSHSAGQRIDGVFGSLVVRQAPEADPNSNQYDYDLSEHIVMAHDIHNDVIFPEFVRFLFDNFREIASDDIIMNGKGVKPGRVNSSYHEHAIFRVAKGNRYRFRLISNGMGTSPLKFSIDHHILKLISTDGRPIEPFDTNAFVAHTAERFDFVLNADKEVGNYWFRVVGLGPCTGLQNLGIIHYEGAPEEIPTDDREYLEDSPTTDIILNECRDDTESAENRVGITALNSAGPDQTPKKADVTFHIKVQTTSPGSAGPTFDHFAFKMPSSPLLYQWRDVNNDDFCENYLTCSKEYCKCIDRIKLNTNEVAEFVFMNENKIKVCHPLHLHGHNFHVVAQEFLPEMITFEEFSALDEKGMIQRKLNSAVVKDTVHIPQTGYLIVRYVPDNPGWWLFHCHSDGHYNLGLAMVLQEGEDEELPPAPEGFPKCGSWPSKSMPPQRMPSASATVDLSLKGEEESNMHHDCIRSCEWPPKPKTCVYNWMVEWFIGAGDICMSGCPNSTVPNPENVECHQDKDCIPLNGIPRPVLVANRSLPGPSIQVCEGDTIVVHVNNNITARHTEDITIHWHGIHQRGTPYMDGTAMITQCPILMDQTFTYNFTAYPAGTHWWHAHSAYQRMEGLFGSFVVRQAPKADPNINQYDYDLSEHIIMVQSWHNYTFSPQYITTLFNNVDNILPDELLMNGEGVSKKKLNPRYSEHGIFNVVQGKRYRFRVISTSLGYCQLQLSVDHHMLKLIAADGKPIEPFDTNAFVLHTAERFDFVLNADQEVGNYWLRVVGLADSEGLQTLGIIHYEGAPEEIPAEDGGNMDDPSTTEIIVNECRNSNESAVTSVGIAQLNSSGADVTPKKADVTYHIAVQTGAIGPTFNHFGFLRPSSPLLYQWRDVKKGDFCEYSSDCSIRHCTCINRIKLNLNEVVEFVFMNDHKFNISLCHPIHLHGHSFHVVAQEFLPEKITFEEFVERDTKGMITRKLNSAVVKDTVHMPQTGYLIIRFIADNPGWWLFHCHSEGHLALGLAMVLQEGDDEDLPPAPEGFPKCGSWPSKSISSQPIPPLSATADLSSTYLSSSGLRAYEVALIVLLVSAIILWLFLYVVKNRNPDNEYTPLLHSRRVKLRL